MQLITLSFLLIAVAQAAAASTYSASIFSAAVATSSVALVSAKNYNEADTDTETETCLGSYDNDSGRVACADLAEYECKETSACKFVPISSNQKAINAVLVAFATISLVVLLVILIVVCRRLPKKETALTQPLLDEENS
eukprot:scaffold5559_cov193-Skeletonema_marinoi.AAC.20